MTSISGLSASHVSPRERMQQQLLANIQSGKIQSADQNALTTALDDIDSALKADRESAKTSGATRRPSREEMKAKIESLIANEVKNGTLTEDQASELKDLFAQGGRKGDHGGKGGPHGAGGPPPGPPPSGGKDADGDHDGSTSAADSATSDSDTAKLLQDFIKALQEGLSKSATYNVSGSKSTNGNTTSLVINFTA